MSFTVQIFKICKVKIVLDSYASTKVEIQNVIKCYVGFSNIHCLCTGNFTTVQCTIKF